MVYTITKIVNNSPKAIVLTNPLREQDRHVVPADVLDPNEQPNIVVLDPPVKIEIIKDPTTYPTALKKALNIYTMKNNWCFWDSGVKDANVLIGAGEGEDKTLLGLPGGATKLELVVSKDGAPSFTTPSEDKRSLNFKILSQGIRVNWCWAAAGASIANYYEKEETWTPCKVANLVFGREDCCGASGVECDKALECSVALKALKHLAGTGSSGLSISGIKKQIDADRPIFAGLVGWKGLAGHGVVITGYNNTDPKKPTIEVQDPDGGSKTVCNLDGFPQSYGIGYTWGVTCYTE
jgi:hypothetical protein